MKKNNLNESANSVETDYNKISAQFASTRHYQWPEMEIFAKYIRNGWSILDLGCGNGRLINSLKGKKVDYLGIDSSKELIKIARENFAKNNFEIMDMERLKLDDSSFDVVFAIASLHHLHTKELRRKSLSEAKRVLRKDGYLFITVWNLWQPKYRKYIWKNLFNMLFRGTKTRFGDTFIPWKNSKRNVLTERYYFAYTINGLKKDLKSSGFEIVELRRSKWNICAICMKR